MPTCLHSLSEAWDWVRALGLDLSVALTSALDAGSEELAKATDNRDQVITILRKLGSTRAHQGAEEQQIHVVLKGMKMYHNICHIRVANIATAVLRPEARAPHPITSWFLSRGAAASTRVASPKAVRDSPAARTYTAVEPEEHGLETQQAAPTGVSSQGQAVPVAPVVPSNWGKAFDPQTEQWYFWRLADPLNTTTCQAPAYTCTGSEVGFDSKVSPPACAAAGNSGISK